MPPKGWLSPEADARLRQLSGLAQGARQQRLLACAHIIDLAEREPALPTTEWMAGMASYICNGSIDWQAPPAQVVAEVTEVYGFLATLFADPEGSQAPTQAQTSRIGDALQRRISELPAVHRRETWPQSVWREHVLESIIRAAGQQYRRAATIPGPVLLGSPVTLGIDEPESEPGQGQRDGPEQSEALGHWLRLAYLLCRFDLCRTGGAWPPLVPAPRAIMVSPQARDNNILASRGRRDRQDRHEDSRG